MPIISCHECGSGVSTEAASCPHCGAPVQKEKSSKGLVFIILGVILLLCALGSLLFPESGIDRGEVNANLAARRANAEYFAAHKDSILSGLSALYQAGQYTDLAEQARPYLVSQDSSLRALYNDAEEQRLLALVKPLPASETQRNYELYRDLAKLRPENAEYVQKVEHYKKALEREKEAEARSREQEQRAAIAAMRTKTDEIEGITWYHDRSTTPYDNNNSFHLYIGRRGEGQPWLRLRLQYVGDDWLFIEKYTIAADDRRFTIVAGYGNVERDNEGGEVWEWYDIPAGSTEIAIVESVIDAKKAIIRSEGKTYRKDRTITAIEKQALRRVLTAYEAMGGR